MTLRVLAGRESPLLFESPLHVWQPSSLDAALEALHAADDALNDGYWIAGALSYELGAMLQGLPAHPFDGPLLVLGAFRKPRPDARGRSGRFKLAAPIARVARAQYETNVAAILREIADGEVYQVNYSVPFDVAFSGDTFDLYRFLAARSRAKYTAYVRCGELELASFSPELFLRFDGDTLTTKPMKGTAPLDNLGLLNDEKNRAEHLMIVDLLRNDLRRICSSVHVRGLFEVERYPTFATMTSTIRGRLAQDTPLAEILRAAFPCGSITGAPKLAAIRQIFTRERQARGFYTGAIGFLSPRRRGWWNVAIRTLQFRPSESHARFDAGGGIVADSNPASEWNEVLLKSSLLRPAQRDFAVLESLRGGPDPSDAAAHLRRLAATAEAFAINVDGTALEAHLSRAMDAGEARFIRVRTSATGRSRITSEPLAPTPTPAQICMSNVTVRSGDPLLAHKTAWRPYHDAAANYARSRGCFDALLRNELGEITEGSRTNIFVQIGNTLYTPPLRCGLLPGILRSQLVSQGRAVERVLREPDLHSADAIYVGNSARGLLRATLLH